MFDIIAGRLVYVSQVDSLTGRNSTYHREQLAKDYLEARAFNLEVRRVDGLAPERHQTRRETFPSLLGQDPLPANVIVSWDHQSGWKVIGRQTPYAATALYNTSRFDEAA